jgi:fatty-acyl-CoA synthase
LNIRILRDLGETVKVFVVLRAGVNASPEEIREWARTRMSAYKVPQIVEFVDSLPRSGSGKVQWRVLQQREVEGAASGFKEH